MLLFVHLFDSFAYSIYVVLCDYFFVFRLTLGLLLFVAVFSLCEDGLCVHVLFIFVVVVVFFNMAQPNAFVHATI